MNDSLRMRLGAVVLAILTLVAVIFAVLNYQQRSRYILPDDGVTWMDSPQGVVAWHVVADSPAARAGIKQGDYVQSRSWLLDSSGNGCDPGSVPRGPVG